MHRSILGILSALCLGLPGSLAAESFQAKADVLLSSGPFANARVGVLFVSLPEGKAVYAKDPELPLPPASLSKLATSAAALTYLKPEFRYTTSLLIPKNELDQGLPPASLSSLVWRGSGDPSISGRDRASPYEIFEIWGASLTAMGIRKIKRLVLDDRYFEGPPLIESWPEDEMSYWYQAQTSAISFNDNCVALDFLPGPRAGKKARIVLDPDFGYIKVRNKTVTAPAQAAFTLDYRREPGTNTVTFFGEIGATDSAHADFVSVHEPALYAAHTLRHVWKAKGPELGRKAVFWDKSGLQEHELTEILTWTSPPLSKLVKAVNTNSQNLYAENLIKTLGKEMEGRGNFEAGLSALRRFLGQAGLADSQYHLVDGSGLSRDNRMSARALVQVLRFMHASPLFNIYYDSLAVPGTDRAARNRMTEESLASRMRLKTGSIADVRNLAGFLESEKGRLYAFAILVSGPGLDRRAVDASVDRLCALAAHGLP